jgi:hypothetical protein
VGSEQTSVNCTISKHGAARSFATKVFVISNGPSALSGNDACSRASRPVMDDADSVLMINVLRPFRGGIAMPYSDQPSMLSHQVATTDLKALLRAADHIILYD